MNTIWIGEHGRGAGPDVRIVAVANSDKTSALEEFCAYLSEVAPPGYEGPQSLTKRDVGSYVFSSGTEWFVLAPYPISPTEEVLYRLRQVFWGIVGTEWSENWTSWPHCNTQAGCWMHTSSQRCDCECGWCKVARTLRPNLHRKGEQR